MRSWILANEVGTGKTFTYLLLVQMDYAYLVQKKKKGEEVKCGPTLIFVPANLVAQTFTEAHENFPELKIWSLYSSPGSCGGDEARSKATLTTAT